MLRLLRFVRSPKAYGWTFVGVAFVAWFFLGGVRDTFGVFIRTWADQFGWSVAAISGAMSVHMVANGVAGPVLGTLVDRLGTKPVFLGMVLLMAAGAMAMATVHSLWQIYLIFGVMLGLAANLVPVTGPLVAQWFPKRRGLAFSLVPAGNPVGLAVLGPVAVLLAGITGWRVVWLGMGMATLILVPIVLFLVRPAPRNNQVAAGGKGRAAPRGAGATQGASLQEAAGSSAFWLLAVGFFVCGYTARMFWTQLVPIAVEGGMTSGQIAALTSVVGFVAVPGLLLFGAAADRVSRSGLLAADFALRVVAFGLMALFLATGQASLMFLGASMMSFLSRATDPVFSTLMVNCFGIRSLGKLLGLMVMLHQIAGAAGVFAAGLVFDLTGSYLAMLVSATVLLGIAAVASWRISEKKVYHEPAPAAVAESA